MMRRMSNTIFHLSLTTTMILLLLLQLGSISGQCLIGNDDDSTKISDEASKALSDARFNFALDSLRRIAEIETQDNIFYSPHSLYEALSLAYLGSQNETEKSLKRVLRIPENFTKLNVSRFMTEEKLSLLERMNNVQNDYEYRVANRLFISSVKKLRDCATKYFGDELKSMDFKTNPSEARKTINDWVSKITANNIRELLSRDAIDETTEAVLVNAVYFKGLWKNEFKPEFTAKDSFYVSKNSIKMATYMNQKGMFGHMTSDEMGVHMVQIPYKGENISMYILLTPYVTTKKSFETDETMMKSSSLTDNVGQLLYRLSNPNNKNVMELRESLDDGLPLQDVNLTIPKFTMERQLPIKELLSAMGADSLFSDNTDFSGFTQDDEEGIKFGDALHRAKIEITEKGTTAAAATAVFTFRSSRPIEPIVFQANYPFAYFIYDKSINAVLFAGIYRNPNKI